MIKKPYLIFSITSVFFCLLLTSSVNDTTTNVSWNTTTEILARIISPSFPDKEFHVTEFGAVGDGIFDCTSAIQKAIDSCSNSGGGKVVIPIGVYSTGAIHLKNNVNLHVSEGSKLLFSKDPDKYLPVVLNRFEGCELMNYSSFIYSINAKNIAVTGKGILDGNADSLTWWPWKGSVNHGWETEVKNQNEDREELFKMMNNQVPVNERIYGESHYLRPNFIVFLNCENILIEDISIIKSPMWEINPILCINVTVRGVSITSHGPNNDGCNPESCKDVLIENCFFDVGDDCIAIKSGREEDGRRINTPSENIIVRNCVMKDGHGGLVIGSEISGGCRNVFIENCQMDSPELDRALRIKTNSLRGGLIENIFMRNITVGEVRQAIVYVDFYYEKGDIGNFTPTVRNIFVENVTSTKSEHAIWLKGYSRSPVENIYISNCRFNGVDKENVISEVKNIVLEEVYINDKKIDR